MVGNLTNEKASNLSSIGKDKRKEELRANINNIAHKIIVLTRNGLFVSLRFLDLALTQFKYLPSEAIVTIATSGEYLIYNPKYIIECYMEDKNALSRAYLHVVLHCIFRHIFVSERLNEDMWNLACDISVECVIDELDLKQTKSKDSSEISKEIGKIRGLVKQMTAEYIYKYLMSGDISEKNLNRWKKLFKRDEHELWWDIARKISEEMKKREEEKAQNKNKQRNIEEAENEAQDEDISEEEFENEDSDENNENDKDNEDLEDEIEEKDENPPCEDDEVENEESDNSDSIDKEEESEEPEPEEGDLVEENFEDSYSSVPNDDKENSDDGEADPDSETQDTGDDSDGEGSGGGNPGDNSETTEEGAEGSWDHDTADISGNSEDKPEQEKPKPDNNMSGEIDGGMRDFDSNDSLLDENQNKMSENSSGSEKNRERNFQSDDEKSGASGGGTGTQEAWKSKENGESNKDGEKIDENWHRKEVEIDSNSQEDVKIDDEENHEGSNAVAEEGLEKQDKEPDYVHNDEVHKELEDKWKDISEKLLVDLETASKEWGDKSDSMLMGIKKINRDKYDYSTFLRKFSTMREDIQINDDEFDYIYYTYGIKKYGNIPLIEPLEYKEARKVRDFVIAIDTSGSCAGEVVQKFLDKTYSIFSQQENFFRKINLHIIQCDAEIQSDIKITNKQAFDDYMKNIKFQGFGGTDFRPVFSYVDYLLEMNEFDDLKGLIYFTDGNGTYPSKRPPYETAFIFVDDDEFDYEVPGWAMKLVLETDEITDEIEL